MWVRFPPEVQLTEFFKSKYNSREPFQEKNESSKKNTRLFIEWIKTDMK